MTLANPTGLCLCGCGERAPIARQNHTRYGWVKGEPLAYVRGHNNRKSPIEYVEQDCGHDTPCWIWQRSRTSHGYGNINLGSGRFGMAHRVIYERHRGPIPEGLHLDHLCRNPPCVNPAHLEPVASAENHRRGARAKLTHELVRAIRASTEPSSAIARSLGVHYDTVWSARSGRSWS